MLVLDYAVDQTRGPVVPQMLWQPLSELRRQQYVEQSRLQLPIFFIHEDDTIGVALADAISGNYGTLRSFNDTAPLGEHVGKRFSIQVSFWYKYLTSYCFADMSTVAWLPAIQATVPDAR